MDVNLSQILVDVIMDPVGGHVHASFAGIGIDTIMDFCYCSNMILDSLTFDDKGTRKGLPPLKLRRLKLLRDFLADRDLPETFDPSAFTSADVRTFLNAGGIISRPGKAIIPAGLSTTIQTQVDLDKTLLNN